jgi:hypothetical protein
MCVAKKAQAKFQELKPRAHRQTARKVQSRDWASFAKQARSRAGLTARRLGTRQGLSLVFFSATTELYSDDLRLRRAFERVLSFKRTSGPLRSSSGMNSTPAFSSAVCSFQRVRAEPVSSWAAM